MNNVESFVTTPHIYTIENIYVSFDSRLNNIEVDIKEIKQSIRELKTIVIHNQELNSARLDSLNFTVSLCFGAVAIFAAFIALIGLFKNNASSHSHTSYYFSWSRKYIPWLRK